MRVKITGGNVDDRKPVPQMVQHLFGKIFADRGYLSKKLFDHLLATFGVQLITKLKKNMPNRLMPLVDKLLLRKRAIAETIIDQLDKFREQRHDAAQAKYSEILQRFDNPRPDDAEALDHAMIVLKLDRRVRVLGVPFERHWFRRHICRWHEGPFSSGTAALRMKKPPGRRRRR